MAPRSGAALLQTEGTRRWFGKKDAETDGEGAGGSDAETLREGGFTREGAGGFNGEALREGGFTREGAEGGDAAAFGEGDECWWDGPLLTCLIPQHNTVKRVIRGHEENAHG